MVVGSHQVGSMCPWKYGSSHRCRPLVSKYLLSKVAHCSCPSSSSPGEECLTVASARMAPLALSLKHACVSLAAAQVKKDNDQGGRPDAQCLTQNVRLDGVPEPHRGSCSLSLLPSHTSSRRSGRGSTGCRGMRTNHLPFLVIALIGQRAAYEWLLCVSVLDAVGHGRRSRSGVSLSGIKACNMSGSS